jgi:hypothetical protein
MKRKLSFAQAILRKDGRASEYNRTAFVSEMHQNCLAEDVFGP